MQTTLISSYFATFTTAAYKSYYIAELINSADVFIKAILQTHVFYLLKLVFNII